MTRSALCQAALAAVLLTAANGLFPTPGDAAPRDRRAYGHGYVVAESRWGHGTVTGAVRPGPRGWQVQTPGGSWIDCVRNRCAETLRQRTVDIFEVMENKDGGPNYFRFERRF